MSSSHCSHCGAPNVADANFCSNCGRETPAMTQTSGPPNPLSRRSNSTMTTELLGATAAPPLVGKIFLRVVAVIVASILGAAALMLVPNSCSRRNDSIAPATDDTPAVQTESTKATGHPRRSTTSYACGATRCRANQYCCEEGRCVPHDMSGSDVCGMNNLRDCDPQTGEPCVAPTKCKLIRWSPSMTGYQCLN